MKITVIVDSFRFGDYEKDGKTGHYGRLKGRTSEGRHVTALVFGQHAVSINRELTNLTPEGVELRAMRFALELEGRERLGKPRKTGDGREFRDKAFYVDEFRILTGPALELHRARVAAGAAAAKAAELEAAGDLAGATAALRAFVEEFAHLNLAENDADQDIDHEGVTETAPVPAEATTAPDAATEGTGDDAATDAQAEAQPTAVAEEAAEAAAAAEPAIAEPVAAETVPAEAATTEISAAPEAAPAATPAAAPEVESAAPQAAPAPAPANQGPALRPGPRPMLGGRPMAGRPMMARPAAAQPTPAAAPAAPAPQATPVVKTAAAAPATTAPATTAPAQTATAASTVPASRRRGSMMSAVEGEPLTVPYEDPETAAARDYAMAANKAPAANAPVVTSNGAAAAAAVNIPGRMGRGAMLSRPAPAAATQAPPSPAPTSPAPTSQAASTVDPLDYPPKPAATPVPGRGSMMARPAVTQGAPPAATPRPANQPGFRSFARR